MFLLFLWSGEATKLAAFHATFNGVLALVASAAVGVGISWTGWNCRNQVSATAYTLLGVFCKLASILINTVMWDKHASNLGIAWLVLCLLSCTAYQQSPLRQPHGC